MISSPPPLPRRRRCEAGGRLALGIALILVSAVHRAHAEADATPPAASTLIQDVIARLPQDTLLVEGDLIMRKPRGVVLNTLRFEMLLAWGESPSRAQYTIRDAFGADLEQLVMLRDAAGALEIHYAAGNPLQPASPPPLQRRIQNTDITWADLSLAFLWWPDARRAGRETIRNRPCHRIDLLAPPVAAGAPSTGTEPPYASVRVWVDEEAAMLLQAEARDAQGQALRTLWVKSLKKTRDRWMIKDMEVQTYPLVHRTRLHVRQFTELDAGTLP